MGGVCHCPEVSWQFRGKNFAQLCDCLGTRCYDVFKGIEKMIIAHELLSHKGKSDQYLHWKYKYDHLIHRHTPGKLPQGKYRISDEKSGGIWAWFWSHTLVWPFSHGWDHLRAPAQNFSRSTQKHYFWLIGWFVNHSWWSLVLFLTQGWPLAVLGENQCWWAARQASWPLFYL